MSLKYNRTNVPTVPTKVAVETDKFILPNLFNSGNL